MNTKTGWGLGLLAVTLALAGCSGGAASTPEEPSEEPTAEATESAPADASTAETGLGEIVVDGEGMTAYYFDKDVPDSGESSCAGDCATAWPSITSESDTPAVEGITGTVGTITGVDGETQITINGMPIYTFAKDSAAGDTNGQGVGDVWWVIAPDGEKISTMNPE